MAVEEFQAMYLARFKNETRPLSEPLFQLLDELFGDVDSFSTDPQLLAANPAFYLDADGLCKQAQSAVRRLKAL